MCYDLYEQTMNMNKNQIKRYNEYWLNQFGPFVSRRVLSLNGYLGMNRKKLFSLLR